MFKVKGNAPTLGDNQEAGTIFPINLPIVSKAYVAYLKKEHPEQYEEMIRLRKFILEATEARNLSNLIGQSKNQELIDKTRENILILLNDLGFEGDFEEGKEMMENYGERVDTMINEKLNQMFPAYMGMLGIREEAKTHDMGRLLLIALDPKRDNRVRYEAKRKFEFMRLLIKIDRELKKKKKGTHDFFWGLMEERVISHEDGVKPIHMISSHDMDDNYRCIKCEFSDESPASLAENQITEHMDSRFMVADMKDGTKRRIRFMYDSRPKIAEDMLLKWLRRPDRTFEQLMRDANGARSIFENEEEMNLAKDTIVERFKAPDPKTGKTYNVNLQKQKNGVGKNGTDKPAIICDKFNLTIEDKDVELQLFTKEQYANYQTHRPNSWVEYDVNRFFDHSLSETFCPDTIYPNLPREQIARDAVDNAFHDFWEQRRLVPNLASDTRKEISKAVRVEKPALAENIIVEDSLN